MEIVLAKLRALEMVQAYLVAGLSEDSKEKLRTVARIAILNLEQSTDGWPEASHLNAQRFRDHLSAELQDLLVDHEPPTSEEFARRFPNLPPQ